MKEKETSIRIAEMDDAAQLLEIYRIYVENTAISFEYKTPDLEEWKERIRKTLRKYPYLVAEKDGEILGYAYTGAFVGRAAYDWSAAVTIYLKENGKGIGLGRKLYREIEEISKAQNIFNLYACIAYPETDDPYVTKNSAEFHAHMGYQIVGNFYKCGYKFGTWYHMVWMEKIIGIHKENPDSVINFPDLGKEILERIIT